MSIFKRTFVVAIATLLFLPICFAAPAASKRPNASQAIRMIVSPQLRALAEAQNATDETPRVINELNEEPEFAFSLDRTKKSYDASIEASRERSLVPAVNVLGPPSLTFAGLSDVDNGAALVNPPDTDGAVGPNHYMQAVNNRVRVWDKNGNALIPPFRQSSLFTGLGGICAAGDAGDPIVLYDRLADRWLISQFAFTGQTTPPYHECVAVSTSGDPLGTYYVYDFIVRGQEFPDYPKLGTWPDGYYMTTRDFHLGGAFTGEGAVVFERQKMLAGDPTALVIEFSPGTLGNCSSGMLPTDFEGITPPPPGAPNMFAIYDCDEGGGTDSMILFDFHADFTNPANSTFTQRADSPLAVAAFDPRNPASRSDVQEPAPGQGIDSIGDRIMHRMVYRNLSGTESWVTTHTVNVSGVTPSNTTTYQAGVRYYQFQRTTPGGAITVFDQATFSPDSGNGATGNDRWMGSAALDNAGNLAVGYSKSSTTLFPSIFYGARLFSESGGLLQGEQSMFDGTGTMDGTNGNRWGDYSALAVDPTDDCTFWYTNETWPTGNTSFNWITRIGRFTVGTCASPASGRIAGTVTTCDAGAPLSNALVQLSNGSSSGTSTPGGAYSITTAPGNYTATFSSPLRACNPAGPLAATVPNGGTSTLNVCLDGSPNFIPVSEALSGGNGNGTIDADECNDLNVTINNFGCHSATGVSATLSTSTPNVTITQPNSPYANTAVDQNTTNTVPFSVSTSAGFVCGTTIDFTLTVTTAEGSTNNIAFSLPSCPMAPITINGDLSATDLQQTARMGRNGIPSSCAGKACPGSLGAGPRLYDIYSFTNGPTAACAVVTLTAGCSSLTNPIFSAAYLNSFDPNNLCTNFAGDPGSSPATSGSVSYNVPVPANQNLLVNVHEINPGLAGCSAYTLAVSGLVGNTAGPGACVPCSIACPANLIVGTDPNVCTATVNYPAPTTAGTCGPVTSTPAAGSTFALGTTSVTSQTTAGPNCSFSVTVNDTQAPSITCPANQSVLGTGTGAIVNYPAPQSTDNCAAPTVVCAPASGTLFPFGLTNVTCTSTDAAANTATCSFSVTVGAVKSNSIAVDPAGRFVIYANPGSSGRDVLFYRALDVSGSPTGIEKQIVANNLLTTDVNGIDILRDGVTDQYFISFGGSLPTVAKYLMKIDVNGNVLITPVAVVPAAKFGNAEGAAAIATGGKDKIYMWVEGLNGTIYHANIVKSTLALKKVRKTTLVTTNGSSIQATQRTAQPDFLAFSGDVHVLKGFGLKNNGKPDGTNWRLSPRTDGGHETGGVSADALMAFSVNTDPTAHKLYLQSLQPNGLPIHDPEVAATAAILAADVSNSLTGGTRLVVYVTDDSHVFLRKVDAATGAPVGGVINIK